MTIDDDTPDIALIHAFCSGDEAAFEALYHRYRRQLYAFLRNLCGNPSLADELFEETWLKVLDKLSLYQDRGKFSAWLFRIGRNLFLDHIRREKPMSGSLQLDEGEVLGLTGSSTGEPDFQIHQEDIGKILGEALQKLPPDQREVFLLRQQEMSFKEIAIIQNCPINTVLGRMRYAQQSLRKIIQNIDDGGLLK
jgi:RNA polymerase sigma-70 factor (ECF subfamily)